MNEPVMPDLFAEYGKLSVKAAEQEATIKRMTAILKELQPMVRRRTGCTLRNRIDAELSKQAKP